jgi:hypothetical protein
VVHLYVLDLDISRTNLRIYLLDVQLTRLQEAAKSAAEDVRQEAALEVRRERESKSG